MPANMFEKNQPSFHRIDGYVVDVIWVTASDNLRANVETENGNVHYYSDDEGLQGIGVSQTRWCGDQSTEDAAQEAILRHLRGEGSQFRDELE